MRLFLVSLAILFGAGLLGYVVIRLLALGEEPADVPALPRGLWLSTALLLASSGTMQAALIAARRDEAGRLRAAMVATTLLGLGFLAVQGACWLSWMGPMTDALGDAERVFLLAGFYVLTGLHALHVIGGLVPLVVVTVRALAGGYSAGDHPGIVYTAMYWHFLDGVWIVLFLTLLIVM